MVYRPLSNEKAWLTLMIAGVLMMSGCTSSSKNMVPDAALNSDALIKASKVPAVEPGSPEEAQAIENFTVLYADYSAASIQKHLKKVYADDAWFGDPFHVVQGIADIEHYFIVMAKPVESCTFRIDSFQRSGEDYFVRWTMMLKSKVAKGEPIEAIGLSHVRFNAQGKVVFQQDYWDTSAMLDRLPVVGYWSRLVKQRISKELE